MFFKTNFGKFPFVLLSEKSLPMSEQRNFGDISYTMVQAATALYNGTSYECDFFSFDALGHYYSPDFRVLSGYVNDGDPATIRVVGARNASVSTMHVTDAQLEVSVFASLLQAYATIVSIDEYAIRKGVGLTSAALAQKQKASNYIDSMANVLLSMGWMAEGFIKVEPAVIYTSEAASLPRWTGLIEHDAAGDTPIASMVVSNRAKVKGQVASAFGIAESLVPVKFSELGLSAWFDSYGTVAVLKPLAPALLPAIQDGAKPVTERGWWGLARLFTNAYTSADSEVSALNYVTKRFKYPLAVLGVQLGTYDGEDLKDYLEDVGIVDSVDCATAMRVLIGITSCEINFSITADDDASSALANYLECSPHYWDDSLKGLPRTRDGDTIVIGDTRVAVVNESQCSVEEIINFFLKDNSYHAILVELMEGISLLLAVIFEVSNGRSLSPFTGSWVLKNPEVHLRRLGVKFVQAPEFAVVEG